MKDTLRYAFIKSLPVMFGYLFLGFAFGIVLVDAGFSWPWALLTSVGVFAGSMQFVMVPLMASGVSIGTMALTALFVNSRHLFYGLSFVESFRKIRGRLYMIFGLTDETYSVLCECRNEDPEEKMRGSWFFITLFDQSYWVAGSLLGALAGAALPIDFTGIDFSMTALFVVILLEQILKGGKQAMYAAVSGLIAATVCVLLLGTERFLMPSLLIAMLAVMVISAARKEASV